MATGSVTRRRQTMMYWLERWARSAVGAWITTTDHKKIGIAYCYTAIIFWMLGGVEALIIRTQLAQPNAGLVSPTLYNEVFTMHGTIMIFAFLMPVWTGLGNYIIPLMIGARDMAFPRLNALGYWLYLFAGLMLATSLIIGIAPNVGWFAYAPLTEATPRCLQTYPVGDLTAVQIQATQDTARGLPACFSADPNMDVWIIAISMLGISSILSSINFIVTILRMRTRGMTINRMPLFSWMMLVTSFLIIFALPSLTVASFLLLFDRHLGTHFYQAGFGGDPLLWQHLFWSFGHPEVYILILPAFGVISEVLPVFSGKPIFGYTFVAWSGVAIGFLSFSVWAHHMFAVGLPPLAQAFFASSTTLIAIPTAVKIFNWIATTWGGRLRFTTAMLFCLGFIVQFVIGGLSGVAVAVAPFDYQVTDTYFVVAHLHYVLPAGAVMAFFAAIYYWFPKMSGRMLDERLGKLNFWLYVLGTNLTFFPMHVLGILGMPRRLYTYPAGLGWTQLNQLTSVGAYITAAGVLVFIYNWFLSIRKPTMATADPWNGFTLEWATSSPPRPDNFAMVPLVRSRRPLWDLKYPESADWRIAAPRERGGPPAEAAGPGVARDEGQPESSPPTTESQRPR
jgi:heme/copper-type cytochrome/quinol oxidase subunit 1